MKEEPPDVKLEWDDYELLSEKNLLPETTSKNIITLFKEECTIPFIARYRKSLIGDMSPDDLRSAKETFSEIGQLKSKIVTVLKSVDKLGQLNENLKESIVSVRTMEQLEHLVSKVIIDTFCFLHFFLKPREIEKKLFFLKSSLVDGAIYCFPVLTIQTRQ